MRTGNFSVITWASEISALIGRLSLIMIWSPSLSLLALRLSMRLWSCCWSSFVAQAGNFWWRDLRICVVLFWLWRTFFHKPLRILGRICWFLSSGRNRACHVMHSKAISFWNKRISWWLPPPGRAFKWSSEKPPWRIWAHFSKRVWEVCSQIDRDVMISSVAN